MPVYAHVRKYLNTNFFTSVVIGNFCGFHWILFILLVAPSPSMSCQVQYCDRRSKPGAEDEFVGGYTIHQFANGSYKIAKRVNRNNPVTVVNPVTVRPKCRSSVNYQLFVVKFCWILIVLFILLLSMLFSVVSFIFKYQVEKESLKK